MLPADSQSMIKSKPYRTFTIVMAFIVLLSSTGFGLVEHRCMMRGKSVELAALKKAETACGACKSVAASSERISSSLPAFSKKPCCEESQKYQKLEVVSATSAFSKILKSLPLGAALGEPAASPRHAFSSFLSSLLHSSPGTSLPPLLPKHHGRTMLSFVQSYLI